MERRGQRWILDTLLGIAGMDVLHPESQAVLELLGYQHADLVRVYSQVKSSTMVTKAWASVAQNLKCRAEYAEGRDFKATARDLFLRAALCYGRAQYTITREDPRKNALHARMVDCYQKVMRYNPTPVERVQIPFEGHELYCVVHLPAGGEKAPCILMLPGMDMFKEDWHSFIQREVLPRGLAAIAIDGPGQGETRIHGLTVTPDNYERAASAVINYLAKRPEIDADKLVAFGWSMGSYTGTRIAAHDSRLKGVATAMGAYWMEETDVFDVAQPSYRFVFMHMIGTPTEAEFEERGFRWSGLKNIAPNIKCPILMVHGEFDELCTLEDALAIYDLVPTPKECWIFEHEFHPLGNVAAEAFPGMVDWLLGAIDGQYKPGMSRPVFIGRDGSFREGTGKPSWWLSEEWLAIAPS